MWVYVETERLRLRRFTETDADNLFALNGDPAVMRFLNGGKPLSLDVIQREILPQFLASYEQRDGFGVWAVNEKTTGAFLGWCSLRVKEKTGGDEAELGYRLCQAAWGKGYASEGARALIRKGFTELGVRRVVAQTMTVNRASRRVMEKAGMTLLRTFVQEWPDVIEGGEHGDVEYALTKAEWERQLAQRHVGSPE